MEDIIKWLQDLEKVILLSSNILLAVLALYNQVRAQKWRQTAKFVMSMGRKTVAGVVPANKMIPPVPWDGIRKYYDKIEKELKQEENNRG